MGGGFSKMKKQAKMMQEQMAKMKEDLKNKLVEGIAANGLVKITLSGEKELKKIKIDPECVDSSDVEGLEDLILQAHKDAFKKLDEEDSNLDFPMSGMLGL
ncbi:MAG: Nucleoid-associated protein [Candidatus Anoxychlamydiales bacterium]|uniref:Nucleoid-associated protein n=1 Tax=marine sediment metagenome TaxID=412755 RepID=A0A0F9FV14_9ZZZZ|nr:Nucleoid-associated protein [Candidatus Anoxychlamydiales bacterium]NGX40579.1 Nucleoid-associated protein [Candidatus Anoxychlamydiales bacterium]HEU64291.1 YbaB/EbfC family nucleoid-associated protein [Chlamydiota bacterium]